MNTSFDREARLLSRFREMIPHNRQEPTPASPSTRPQENGTKQDDVQQMKAQEKSRLEALRNRIQKPTEQSVLPGESVKAPEQDPLNRSMNILPNEEVLVRIPGINPPIRVHRNFVKTENDPSGQIKFKIERVRSAGSHVVKAWSSVQGMEIVKA